MTADINAYSTVMTEIRRRAKQVSVLEQGSVSVMFPAARVETMVLQVRMITELIALGSLAANKKRFEEMRLKFEKLWKPDKILAAVEKINPKFYPIPTKVWKSERPGIRFEMCNIQSGYLTREKLVEVHGRCGNLLHARNPYGKPPEYEKFQLLVPEWMKEIEVLLGCHQVQLAGTKTSYLVQMNHGGGDQVVMNTLEPFSK